ncbi:unnamed protein product [Triticum turgidum subsp. durum]|uniref:GPI inositol-deacylase n=1 Tax=Triticum turgidum subsp. durum TaxID=4567 RepID=A0A9R0YFQ8_TRITD|nr:unnamed protein product [Triticum turgidum subsp. durum]
MIHVLKVRAFILTLNCLMLADGKLSLIGHSAGGWLARVYMEELGTSDISLLLTLGTPHLPPPKGVSGVIDQTRGLLNYVEKNCAPAVYTPELRYVCIAGRYIQGAPLTGNSIATTTTDELVTVDTPSEVAEAVMVSADNKSAPTGPTFRARFVGQGYKQVTTETQAIPRCEIFQNLISEQKPLKQYRKSHTRFAAAPKSGEMGSSPKCQRI